MIRIIQKQDLLYILNGPRKEHDMETTKLLYTYEDLELSEVLRNNLRPFRYLRSRIECYKLKLLNYLPEVLYYNYIPRSISKSEIIKTLGSIQETAKIFGIEKPVEINQISQFILYTCDIWNIFDEIYLPKEIRLLQGFQELDQSEKALIRKIYQATGKLKKLEIARSENWSPIYEFLPEDIQENLLLFGSDLTNLGKEFSIPEFRNQEDLGPKFPDLAEEIYKEFQLGEILLEGAENVKERLSQIYKRCEIQKNPKMKDLEEFFVIVPCWSKGRRGFRIDFRKA